MLRRQYCTAKRKCKEIRRELRDSKREARKRRRETLHEYEARKRRRETLHEYSRMKMLRTESAGTGQEKASLSTSSTWPKTNINLVITYSTSLYQQGIGEIYDGD